MAKFTDSGGNDWIVEVNVTAIKQVKAALDVDMLEISPGGNMLTRLATDPVLLCNVLYVLCKKQADERGVSDEDFGRSLGGDVLETATDALLEAYIGFFPRRQRRALEQAKAKMEVLTEMGVAAAEKILDSGQLEREMQAEIDGRLTGGKNSGNSPASSESTPAP